MWAGLRIFVSRASAWSPEVAFLPATGERPSPPYTLYNMAKEKTVYVCSECGADSPKWLGRCPACGAWNTYKELRVAAAKPAAPSHPALARPSEARPVALSEVRSEAEPRLDTGDAELNRVLGGGLVAGEVVLLGGEPGIGKSTLLLQTVLALRGRRVLYVSGEESERQIKLRADRLGRDGGDCLLLCETSLEAILRHAREVRPDLLVVDSVQTLASEAVESGPGSLVQVRECATALLHYAKSADVPVVLVGHITKEGTLAGPKVLEHIVDAVLQFEGDRHYLYRILRGVKNRFGSTDELGIYEMEPGGLRPVVNPSELLLTDSDESLSGVAVAAAIEGVRPLLIETQALVSTAAYGTPQRSATGFDLRRLNMLLAVLEKRAGFKLAQKDVFLNIAGGLRVTDPAIDLSVIAAVLSSNFDVPVDRRTALAGEVGLSGEIRPVTRIAQRVAEADKLGFRRIVVPRHNLKSLGAPARHSLEIIPADKVEDALRVLFG